MRTVLFDCDGVLVNSEDVAHESQGAFLASYGLNYTIEDFEKMFTGRTMTEVHAQISADYKAKFGRDLPSGFFDLMQQNYLAAEAGHLKAIDGVPDMIRDLDSLKVRFAIASNSALANTERKLNKVGLRAHFNAHVYSKDMVALPKPAPDVYLYAMNKLGESDPDRCIVVEDSVTGVTAGVAAGMCVLAYAGGVHRLPDHPVKLKAAGAFAVYHQMPDLARHMYALLGVAPAGPNPSAP